jgi:hypothetical protein
MAMLLSLLPCPLPPWQSKDQMKASDVVNNLTGKSERSTVRVAVLRCAVLCAEPCLNKCWRAWPGLLPDTALMTAYGPCPATGAHEHGHLF